MDEIPKVLTEQSKMPQSSLTGEIVPKIPQDDNNDNSDSSYGSIERSPDKNNIDTVPDKIDNSSNIVRAICFRNMNKSIMSFI